VVSSFREGASFYGSRTFKTRHRGDGRYAWKDMRGNDIEHNALFSYGSLDERVPEKHPLRAIRTMVDEASREMSGRIDEVGLPAT
jgi:hypothetical protein